VDGKPPLKGAWLGHDVNHLYFFGRHYLWNGCR